MPAISTIASLTKLDLFGSRLTDFGVRFLRKLAALAHIEICGGGLTDNGVATLASLPAIRNLNVSQNGGITDEGVALLANLPVLEALNLSNTSVGVGALPSLQRITSLTSLALYSTTVPPSLSPSLKASLPRLITLGMDGAAAAV